MPSRFELLSVEVTKLSKVELKQILDRVILLLKGKRLEYTSLTAEESLFYSMLIKGLRELTTIRIHPEEAKSIRPRARGFDMDKFRSGFAQVKEFISKLSLTKVERNRFFWIYIKALITYVAQERREDEYKIRYRRLKRIAAQAITSDTLEELVEVLKEEEPSSRKRVGMIGILEVLGEVEEILDTSMPGYHHPRNLLFLIRKHTGEYK